MPGVSSGSPMRSGKDPNTLAVFCSFHIMMIRELDWKSSNQVMTQSPNGMLASGSGFTHVATITSPLKYFSKVSSCMEEHCVFWLGNFPFPQSSTEGLWTQEWRTTTEGNGSSYLGSWLWTVTIAMERNELKLLITKNTRLFLPPCAVFFPK